MIDDILELMDLIVNYLSTLAEEIRGAAVNLFYGFMFILIVATVPVWILPFLIWKSRRGE